MTEYLKQSGSGHIYVWTEALAKREDMTPCGGPDAEAQDQSPAADDSSQAKSLEDMTKAELLVVANGMGLPVAAAMAKADILAKIREAQEL